MKQLTWIFILQLTLISLSCENRLKTHLAEQKKKNSQASSPNNDYLKGVDPSYAKVFSTYERLRTHLASDNYGAIPEVVKGLSLEAKGLSNLREVLSTFGQEKDPKTLRLAFGRLSEATVKMYQSQGFTFLDLYHCPMAQGYQYWLQPKGQPVSNPYMGTKMVSCGSKMEP